MLDFVLFLWETLVQILAFLLSKPWLTPIAKLIVYILRKIFEEPPEDE